MHYISKKASNAAAASDRNKGRETQCHTLNNGRTRRCFGLNTSAIPLSRKVVKHINKSDWIDVATVHKKRCDGIDTTLR